MKAQYEMVAGLEDLGVDAQGRLWGLSESGTRKYLSRVPGLPGRNALVRAESHRDYCSETRSHP